MKSWIAFLIPEDEYKEKKMLYFISEGGILTLLFLIVMVVGRDFLSISAETVLFLSIPLFVLYVYGRYIMSGIEYTDIATAQSYRKEARNILIKSVGFALMFMFLYIAFLILPGEAMASSWVDALAIAILAGIMMFLINFISLKRSYRKNKELL